MNPLITILKLCLLIWLASINQCHCQDFNTQFSAYLKTKIWFNVTQLFESLPAVTECLVSAKGKSTDVAKDIDDLATYALNYLSANKLQSVNVSASLCPFITQQTSSCSATSKYRSYDGTCNNLAQPMYGSQQTPFKRYLSPVYDDGLSSYRAKSASGASLPNPRVISTTISTTTAIFDKVNTILHTLFGQFLAHDITGVSATTDSTGIELNCPCGSTNPLCMSISMPTNDTMGISCMGFTRSSASFTNLNCQQSYREQFNLYSSYIDGSAIYGNSQSAALALRSNKSGQLLTSSGISSTRFGVTNRTYLPLSSDKCSRTNSQQSCFFAGDHRTNENLGLVSIQTLFNREHNRIATVLAANNPSWSDETIYQETRRIVVAELQHITYNDYLPLVTGNSSLSPLSGSQYFTGYDPTINPAIANEFSTAAFRYGHSNIVNIFNRVSSVTNSGIPGGQFFLTSTSFQTDMAYDTLGGINSIMLGLTTTNAWKFGNFADQVQNRLFESSGAVDLLALNINRGRDHGMPSYATVLNYCFNYTVKSFIDIRNLVFPTKYQTLQTVYSNVSDIDFYAGGLSEVPVSNGIVGPTFACIIQKQFDDLKRGDRFYYENGQSSSTAFSLDQLTEIKKASLARLICDNYDVTSIQPLPFGVSSNTGNSVVNCSTFSSLNLAKWTN